MIDQLFFLLNIPRIASDKYTRTCDDDYGDDEYLEVNIERNCEVEGWCKFPGQSHDSLNDISSDKPGTSSKTLSKPPSPVNSSCAGQSIATTPPSGANKHFLW